MAFETGRDKWIAVHEWVIGPKLRKFARLAGCTESESLGVLCFLWLWGLNGNADKDGLLLEADMELIKRTFESSRHYIRHRTDLRTAALPKREGSFNMNVKGGVNMSDASAIPYRPSQSVRAIYEPDGTPLFCGRDIAEVLGYKAPVKAVERAEGVTLYRRRVRWRSTKDCRRYSAEVLCLDRSGCEKLAEFRKAGSRDAARWVTTELIQKAELNRPQVPEGGVPARTGDS